MNKAQMKYKLKREMQLCKEREKQMKTYKLTLARKYLKYAGYLQP